MPKMIQMVAEVAFDRNGKMLQKGDHFDAFPIEAASLRYKRQASFFSGVRPAAPTYGTRHMTAHTPGSAPPPEAPREASSAPAQTAQGESTQTSDGSRTRRAARSQTLNNRSMNQRGTSEE
jgi:hypothetical protein